MSETPTLIFIPGSWHKPSCYDKVIKLLQDEYNIKCISVTLPSTTDNPNATFKDDIDAAQDAITSEMTQGRDVIVVAHSYGGMIGNSAIKGLTRPKTSSTITTPEPQTPSEPPSQNSNPTATKSGYVTALVLIASGFTITGFAFMDPLLGLPLPFFRADKDSGYAVLTVDPRQFFYHDLTAEEAEFWSNQLTTQSLKALYEGGEHAYAGWMDVPTWYLGTAEDQGLPIMAQRMQIGTARACGAVVYHVELQSSHSPFLSMPEEVVAVLLEAVRTVSGNESRVENESALVKGKGCEVPVVRLAAPGTWFRFGIPFLFGRVLGWSFVGFMGLRRLCRRK